MTPEKKYYIGLMSGTSLDGIDGVLARFDDHRIEILERAEVRYPDTIRDAFRALLTPGEDEINRIELASQQRNALAMEVIHKLCRNINRQSVIAIADHGQTIRHFPDANPAYSLQTHRAAELAELSGIDCIVDFRSRDIAAGGQGAPLVPAFHQACLSDSSQYRVVVNIGGLANVSLLSPGTSGIATGFDTGPGNTLLDDWCQLHTGAAYDHDGDWGASGQVNSALLAQLMADPYFQRPPPKSTGREIFNLSWLHHTLGQKQFSDLSAVDIQASLTALTAQSVLLGVRQACTQAGIDPETQLEGIYVCGGGAYNRALMQQLCQRIEVPVKQSSELGIPPTLVEACAFAWLGKQTIEQRPVPLRHTTGARQNSILGVIYRA